MFPEPVGWVDRELSLYQKSKERLVHLAYSELRNDLLLKPRGRSFLSALVFSLLLPLFTCSPPWLPSVTVTDDWTRIRRESLLPTASSSENWCQPWIRNHEKQPWPLGKEREHMSSSKDKPLRTPCPLIHPIPLAARQRHAAETCLPSTCLSGFSLLFLFMSPLQKDSLNSCYEPGAYQAMWTKWTWVLSSRAESLVKETASNKLTSKRTQPSFLSKHSCPSGSLCQNRRQRWDVEVYQYKRTLG